MTWHPSSPLTFAPLTRWVLAWPDGSHWRDVIGNGPRLFLTKASAIGQARYVPEVKPVKVRVTIEVVK